MRVLLKYVLVVSVNDVAKKELNYASSSGPPSRRYGFKVRFTLRGTVETRVGVVGRAATCFKYKAVL